MAQDFFLQGVLATEERSGFYGRGSMCALEEKDKQGMPSTVCYSCHPQKNPNGLKKHSL